jgi:hypothetical protein
LWLNLCSTRRRPSVDNAASLHHAEPEIGSSRRIRAFETFKGNDDGTRPDAPAIAYRMPSNDPVTDLHTQNANQPSIRLAPINASTEASPSVSEPALAPSMSLSPNLTCLSSATTSQNRSGQTTWGACQISKLCKQCNLATTLVGTILMTILGFLMFKPQNLATQLALWESKKDYRDYCSSLNVSVPSTALLFGLGTESGSKVEKLSQKTVKRHSRKACHRLQSRGSSRDG